MTDDDIVTLLRRSAGDYLQGRAQRSTSVGPVPRFDRAEWQSFAELGWLGLALPEALGGSGLGLTEACALAEQLGRQPCEVTWLAASLLPSLLLARLPESRVRAQVAADFVSGARPLALAWQEVPGQPDSVLPDVSYRDQHLTGVKRFVPCVDDQAVLLVTADHDGSLAVLAVDATAPGVTIERRAAGLGHEATIRFEGAKVSGELGRGSQAADALVATLMAGRIALSAQLGGTAQGVIEKTFGYVSERVQFGKPLSAFQSIRHRCVDQSIAVRLAQASWHHALQCHEHDPASLDTARAVSAAKARCADVAFQAGKEAVQMHGGMGFTEECGVGAYLRAALHGRAWLGSPQSHRRRFMAHHPLFREAEHV